MASKLIINQLLGETPLEACLQLKLSWVIIWANWWQHLTLCISSNDYIASEITDFSSCFYISPCNYMLYRNMLILKRTSQGNNRSMTILLDISNNIFFSFFWSWTGRGYSNFSVYLPVYTVTQIYCDFSFTSCRSEAAPSFIKRFSMHVYCPFPETQYLGSV